MSHLLFLFMNEVKKPLETLEQQHVGFIDETNANTIYYKIDDRLFAVEVRELKGESE